MSPRQPSREFYKQKQRSILGIGITYIENDIKISKNIDLISHNLNQTGNTTVQALKYLNINYSILYMIFRVRLF